MKKFIVILLLIEVTFINNSCQKNDAPIGPDTIDSVKIFGVDSTLLVKSIMTKYYDKAGNYIDSNLGYIYYDTLNKKIILSPNYTGTAINPSYELEQSYNSALLITQLKTNPLLLTDGGQAAVINISYDQQGVISDQTTTYHDGTIESFHLDKTNHSDGGYTLSTKSSSTDFLYDSILNVYDFDVSGNLVSSAELSLPSLAILNKDSLLFDASGNITKVLETNIYGPNSPTQATYSLYEFTRDTKGSQLSDLNKLLFHGISQFPDQSTIELGGLLNGYENFFFYQYTRFPSISTKVYEQSSSSYITFNPNPQYDNLGRLVKYKMYNGDSPFYYMEYDIGYYK